MLLPGKPRNANGWNLMHNSNGLAHDATSTLPDLTFFSPAIHASSTFSLFIYAPKLIEPRELRNWRVFSRNPGAVQKVGERRSGKAKAGEEAQFTGGE